MIRLLCSFIALLLGILAAAPATAQVVTNEGWTEKTAGIEFYIEVPMIDNKALENYGVGGNITAEAITNAVRYADAHPSIHHVVFMMDTGGGALFHAKAMEDVIERHHQNTEYHIVVQNAISAGIWTAFSCDSIFMCRAGTIGGATAYYKIGNTSVVASDIPSIAARLELTAIRNGYPKEIIKPLMLMESELYYWVDNDGQKVLSNEAPKDKKAVKDYRQLDRKDTVLTLTSKDAVQIGIAQAIEAYDASLVGKKIGSPGWTRANRYGKVVDEIGWIYNTTRVMEDQWVQRKLAQPRFPVTPQNRKNRMIKDMLENRKKHSAAIDALRMINDALNELPDVHPERHIYLPGPDKKTLVADPEQWQADATKASVLARRITLGLNNLKKAYTDLEIDASNLEDIEDPLRKIAARATQVSTHGNAAYWESEDNK